MTLNKAFWIWHYANEREPLWRIITCDKFGEERRGWITRDFQGTFFGRRLERNGLRFLLMLLFVLGNGRRSRFWKDVWCGRRQYTVLFIDCLL